MASNDKLASPRAGCTGCDLRGGSAFASKWCVALIAALLFLVATPSFAQLLSSKSSSKKGSVRKVDRINAISAIPFAELTPESGRQIEQVVTSPSIYRKLPTQTIQCDRDFFVFMVRNPETIVHTWQLMGITALSLDRTGPYRFASSDGAGTDSEVELVYGKPDLHVYYGTGVYEGPLFKKTMTGQCVIVLRSGYGQSNGRPIVNCRMDVFIRMPQSAIDVAAKTLHPLFGKAADVNFAETASFFQRLNTAAMRDGQSIERLVGRLDEVSPDVRSKMVQVAHATHERWGGVANKSPIGASRPVQRVSGSGQSQRSPVQRISRYPASGPLVR